MPTVPTAKRKLKPGLGIPNQRRVLESTITRTRMPWVPLNYRADLRSGRASLRGAAQQTENFELFDRINPTSDEPPDDRRSCCARHTQQSNAGRTTSGFIGMHIESIPMHKLTETSGHYGNDQIDTASLEMLSSHGTFEEHITLVLEPTELAISATH